MARTVTAVFSIIRTAACFMSIRAGIGMGAGPVTGKRDAVFIYKAALDGRGNGCGSECLME